MANLLAYPMQDNFETTLAQSRDGAVGTIYLNDSPTFTFPATADTYFVVNPGKSNMQVAKIDSYASVAKTANVSSITVNKGASVAYTQQTHAVGSTVIISDNYAFWEDMDTAIISKVGKDETNLVTGTVNFTGTNFGFAPVELTTAERDALSGTPLGALIRNTDDAILQYNTSGGWVDVTSTTPPLTSINGFNIGNLSQYDDNWTIVNDCESATNWSAQDDATNFALVTSGQLLGSGCLEWDKAGTNVLSGVRYDPSTVDYSDYRYQLFHIFIPTITGTGLTDVTVVITDTDGDTGTWNITTQFEGTALSENAWNFVSFDMDTPDSQSGTLDISIIDHLEYSIKAASGDTFSNALIDYISVVKDNSGTNVTDNFYYNGTTFDMTCDTDSWAIIDESNDERKIFHSSPLSSAGIFTMSSSLPTNAEFFFKVYMNTSSSLKPITFRLDDDNRVSLGTHLTSVRVTYEVATVETTTILFASLSANETVYWKVKKIGNRYEISASKDGANWESVTISASFTTTSLIASSFTGSPPMRGEIVSYSYGLLTAGHAGTSDFAYNAQKVALEDKASAFVDGDLLPGQLGEDTANDNVWIGKNDGTVENLSLTVPGITSKFGGDGSDGVQGDANLTIAGSNNTYIVKDFTSWTAGTVARTCTVTPTGCIVHIKVSGDADFTNWTFDFQGKGSLGGAAPATVSQTIGINGTDGITNMPFFKANKGTRGATYSSGGTGGAAPEIVDITYYQSLRALFSLSGAGGASGGSGDGGLVGQGGGGGAGGGVLIIEVAGSIIWSSSAITVEGADGSNGDTNGIPNSSDGGGGGGGGGGVCIVLYNGTETGSVTPVVLGGNKGLGGTGGAQGYTDGGGGGGGGGAAAAGVNGGGGGANGGDGGDGGAGWFMIEKNEVFT